MFPNFPRRERCGCSVAAGLQWESAFRLEIPEEVLESAVELSIEYLPDQYLPGKAIWLLEEALRRVGNSEWGGRVEPGHEWLAQLGRGSAAIIPRGIDPDHSHRGGNGCGQSCVRRRRCRLELMRKLEECLSGKSAGGSTAIQQLCSRLKVAAAGWPDVGAAGPFFFSSDPGSGKVRLARALAQATGGSAQALARVDLSQYRAGDAEEHLLGSAIRGV